jgi:hypothetical protein
MKKQLLLFFVIGLGNILYAQNTFPSSGNVGIGTTSPRGALDVANGDIWLSATPDGGSNQTTYLSGHIFLAPYSNTNISYLQARRGNTTGTSELRLRTMTNGSLIETMHLSGNGNVGIGTITPGEKLELTGSIYMNAENNGLIIDEGGNKRVGFMKYAGREGGIWRTQNIAFEIGRTNTTTLPGSPTVFTTDLFVAGSGNVGIGTKNVNDANYKLFVETGIRTRKVKVDVSTWADYVFSPSYKLPSLKEVEAFIKKNNHLPDVPSEAEVKKEGLDLGENQAVLLKKIEELTLYIIDQNKKLEDQNKRIGNLERQLSGSSKN